MKAALVGLAASTLLVAAIFAPRGRDDAGALPGWITDKLAVARFTARPANAADFGVERSTAIDTVRTTAFLGEGPAAEPTAVPVLVSGRIGRGPPPPGSGDTDVPVETDVPFWVIAWLGASGEEIGAFWNPGADSVVDVVFLVDGVTGDCCWLNLFSPSS